MNSRESNSPKLSLRVSGRHAIAQAVAGARTFGEAQQLGGDELARLCVVVEELIANLYDHGGVTEVDEIALSLARDPAGLRLSITDPGAPFNPWAARENDGSIQGGAGVRLIQAWSALVSYQSSERGNRLELLVPVGGRSAS